MSVSYAASGGPTLGVEVELNLVDDDTRALSCSASEVLEDVGETARQRLKHELFECTIEAITGICDTVAAARSDLETSIDVLRRAAARRGLGLVSSGTHPFTHWSDLEVTADPRYLKLVDDMQWPVRRLAITGIHFHVGVRDADKAIAMVNALTVYLPHLLAVSTSSPFWHGFDTGLASVRTKVFESLPTAGLPPTLGSWADFEAFMDTLVAAGAIGTVREVWWDIRPHPDFGTVELRMCDAMATMTEICAVAALAQCLVEWFDTLIDRGYSLPQPNPWIVRQNKWLAARYGLAAPLIVDGTGTRLEARVALAGLVDELVPVAHRLHCAAELDSVRAILEVGSSAERQRRVVAAGGGMADVVDALREELLTDSFGP